jgi:hypothetical protein
MGSIGKILVAPAVLTQNSAEAMLKGVTANRFARQAVIGGKPVHANHPAWVYGHLAFYQHKILSLVGKPAGITQPPAIYEALFKNGSECRDDPEGTIYPSMDELTTFYRNSFAPTFDAIANADDALLLEPNPMEGRMKELFPLRAQAIAFLLSGHPMSHLGQVSTWRRIEGLPSAF